MKGSDPSLRTVEGLSWPIVLMAELVGERADAWRKALEEAQMIVLAEGSLLRAAVVVQQERPMVVLVTSNIPAERTAAVRESARDVGAALLVVPMDAPPEEVKMLVERRIAAVKLKRGK
jgi:hypothetical protein